MRFFDYVFALIMLWGLWGGFRKGLARQITSTIGIGGSFGLAGPMAYWVQPFVGGSVIVAWSISFFVIWAGAALAGWQIWRLLDNQDESDEDEKRLNRALGTIFGGVKGFTTWLCLCFAFVSLSTMARDALLGSWSGRATVHVLALAGGVLPREYHEQIDEYRRAIEGHEHTHGGEAGEPAAPETPPAGVPETSPTGTTPAPTTNPPASQTPSAPPAPAPPAPSGGPGEPDPRMRRP